MGGRVSGNQMKINEDKSFYVLNAFTIIENKTI